MTEILRTLSQIPRHLAEIVVALLCAVATDRSAACFALAAIPLILAWGWGTLGVLLVVYGVLMFVQGVAQAALR